MKNAFLNRDLEDLNAQLYLELK